MSRRQKYIQKRAYPIADFCRAYGISRRTVYREISDGRLYAVKCRGRTLIPSKAAKQWLESLQAFSSKS